MSERPDGYPFPETVDEKVKRLREEREEAERARLERLTTPGTPEYIAAREAEGQQRIEGME